MVHRDGNEIRVGKTLEFMQILFELTHALQSLSKRMEASIGVTAAQRLAVRLIRAAPGLAAGELATAMRIHPSTLTGILRRLEAAKAVARSVDANDARRARLSLTERGRAIDKQQRPTVEAAVRRALGRAREADIEACRRVLEILAEEIEREARATD